MAEHEILNSSKPTKPGLLMRCIELPSYNGYDDGFIIVDGFNQMIISMYHARELFSLLGHALSAYDKDHADADV